MNTTPAYGVSYEELHDSPKGKWDEQGLSVTRRFRVPTWGNVYKFCSEVMGVVASPLTPTPVSTPGLSFPSAFTLASNGWPNCMPAECSFEPFSENPEGVTTATANLLSGTTTNSYDNGALVTVQYTSDYCTTATTVRTAFSPGTLKGFPTGTFLKYEVEFGGEALLLPVGQFAWGTTYAAANALKEGQSVTPAIIVPSSQHTVTWFWIAQPPWGNIEKTIGKVNSQTFLDQPAETVLFLGCQPIPVFRTQENAILYRLVYRFAGTAKFLKDGTTKVGWNHFYRDDAASGDEVWQKIVNKASNTVYQTTDFGDATTGLFVYGS